LWLHSLKVAQLLRSAACLHTNQSRLYLNHLVYSSAGDIFLHAKFLVMAGDITQALHATGKRHSCVYNRRYIYKLSKAL